MNATCQTCHATLLEGVCPRCLLTADDEVITIANGSLALGAPIGEGGMGEVYRARHLRLRREVAVKFLSSQIATLPEFRARFQREAHALALLNHPNIVTIHDYGQEENQNFIVMELVAGASLSAQLPLPPARAIEVILQVCDALSYAHAQGIVHRDIKPSNILLDQKGNAKVSDFGLARMAATSAGKAAKGWALTHPHESFGSMYYLAPECLQGAEPDTRMDVYSLGVLTYQVITGSLPIGNFTRLPGAMDAVVRKSLSQDPSHRYASVDEFASALRGAQHHMHSDHDLPPAELQWQRAVAIMYAAASGIAGWATMASLTPVALQSTEIPPMGIIAKTALRDGTLISMARFEVWPTLGALFAFAIALASSGFLARYLRQNGLDRPVPDRPLRESPTLLRLGFGAVLLYAARIWSDYSPTAYLSYLPFLGALLVLYSLFVFWMGALEAKRRSRSLRKEPKLLLGLGLVLLPPGLELLAYARSWI